MALHWAMSGGWWPDRGIAYREPTAWLPKGPNSRCRLDKLVDHLSQQMLHRRATPTLVKACCEAVAYPPSAVIDKDHPIMRWEMPRLLVTLLDSPAHMTR